MARQQQLGKTFYVGINGSQGSGKTTLADYLVCRLQQLGLSACAISIDDFYLTKSERQHLADTVHPLFKNRGVPGTHDMLLAKATLAKLAKTGQTPLPIFNKAIDDRAPESDWQIIDSPVDVVILEGWCVAIPAQIDEALITPINDLEHQHDPRGDWRRYSNDCLRDEYADLWTMLALTVMLKAPSFDTVFAWRLEQEDKLRAKTTSTESNALMSPTQIREFIAHYERLTQHALDHLPENTDWLFVLDNKRRIVNVHSDKTPKFQR